MNKFDTIVMGALDIAHTEAMRKRNPQVHSAHLFYGLLKVPASYSSRELKEYKTKILNLITSLPTTSSKVSLDHLRPDTKLSEWLTYASSHAIQAGREEVNETDLLRYIHQYLPEINIDMEKLNANNQESEIPDFLINLNELAKEGKLDPVIGRTKEIRAVMEILGRRSKNNPVLVGSAGVGKTAIVEGLAEAIEKGNVPDVLQGKTVFSLNLGSLMAGTKFRGEFEERIQNLLKFIKEKAGEAILFIDEIHQIVGAGKTEGAMDAANLLKPALARGELHCIGATTNDEYQKFILGDSALERRFRGVPVDEPTKEDAIEILMGVKEKLEIHHGIKISEDAIYNSVYLSDQYINNKFLPDKAIDLVDEAASALKLSAEAMPTKLVELESEIRNKKILFQVEKNPEIESEIKDLEEKFQKGKKIWEQEVLALKKVSELTNQLERLRFDLEQAERLQKYEEASKLKYSLIPEVEKSLDNYQHDWVLNAKDVASVISRQTGIPLEKILKSKQEHILELETYLKNHVYGQQEPLREISETLIASHAGLTDPTRPLGSFLLVGPSGVGKTETAKTLCRFLFNSEANMIRLDMSEFSEKHSVAKLIGAPAGYVGYEEGGILTEAVRRKPYSIILFDEIEKAHSDFSDILLQILDDGRLTDNKGRTISFKNTVIFLTTNSKNIEVDFKPEVLGRIDGRLNYKELDSGIMEELVERELKKLNHRLKDKKVFLKLDKNLMKKLAESGYSSIYGARPLQSLFNKEITRPLSHKLVSGDLQEGTLLAKKSINNLVEFQPVVP